MILDLRLHGIYFDMIKSGRKKNEYRDINEYYVRRLMTNTQGMDTKEREEFAKELRKPSEREEAMKKHHSEIRQDYTHCRFRRGASNTFMLVKIEGIKMYATQFVIALGEVVE